MLDEDQQADRFFDDLLHAVDQQLESPATAYVRATYDRLLGEGLDDAGAREAIARCLAEVTDAMYRTRRPFDEPAYRALLEMTKPGEGSEGSSATA